MGQRREVEFIEYGIAIGTCNARLGVNVWLFMYALCVRKKYDEYLVLRIA